MRLLALAALCSSFIYASDVQQKRDPKHLEVVLKLGTFVPPQLVEPLKEGEKPPQKDDVLAWKIQGVYKVVRVTNSEQNPLGGYCIQYDWDDKTWAPLTMLFKILKQAKPRL